jgi:putative nucleotidyltransferase with HDIG domain
MRPLLLVAVFLLINASAFYLLYSNYKKDHEEISDYLLSQQADIYEAALTTYRLNARSVFENIVMQPKVLKILRQLPAADEATFHRLHDALHSLLKTRYDNMKKGLDIRQLHFHTTESRSFLRMHRPEKYGDSLADVRYSLKLANTNKIYVEGFEEGRIYNGMRYVYPIIDDGNHLGSVEISISMSAIIKQLGHIFQNHTFYFMIDKRIVGERVFASEKSNYRPSKLFDQFLVDREVRTLFNPGYEIYLKRFREHKELIPALREGKAFVASEKFNGQSVIAAFLPILNLKQEPVAYLVSFETNDALYARWMELIYQLITVLMATGGILTMIFYFTRKARDAEVRRRELDRLVHEKTEALEVAQEEQIQTYRDIVLALVNLTEERDTYTAGHTRRVADYAKKLAAAMGYNDVELEQLHEAAILHDIGKIVTPDSVLLKPGKLTPREYDIIKEHVIVSASILTNINFHPDVIEIVKYHHERCDGSGYPYGITHDEIPMLARILAVADTFDAMTTNRIYKPRKSIDAALEELNSLAGTLYDTDVVAVAQTAFQDVRIDMSVTQLPTNVIEQERLSHYFKDPMTNLYNLRYLHLLLEFGMDGTHYSCANTLSIRHFTRFNHEQGWEAGNRVLVIMAEMLEARYPDAMLFRVYGDDFLILTMEHLEVDLEALRRAFSKRCRFELEFELMQQDMKDQNERQAFKKRLEHDIG